jgi:two-component sensor histidine kinase
MALAMEAPSLREPREPTLIIAVCLAVGLVMAGLVMAFYNEKLSNAQKTRDASVEASILAGSLAAPLAFDDQKTAQEFLDAESANPDVEAAAVYQPGGQRFAAYTRAGASAPQTTPTAKTAVDGYHLEVATPVVQGSTKLGSVYLRMSREPAARRLSRYAGIGLLISMAALLVALLGASTARLTETHRELRLEMDERKKAEEALLQSQKMEALAQLEIATERSRTALRESEQQLELALRAGSLGSWTQDLTSGRLTLSKLCRVHFGLGPDDPVKGADDILARLYPDDRDRQTRLLREAVENQTVLDSEYRTVGPDGELRWILIRGRADYDGEGAPQRMAGVSMDITQRKAAEERQRLLLDELNHRVKNTLATVQSIAQQTGRMAQSAQSFEAAFVARINALARVHDLLTKASWVGASLSEVLAETLEPYKVLAETGRFELAGPPVRLGPNAAVTLTMAFHELATNAVKYGALSSDGGRVEVQWRADREHAPTAIKIIWREMGGPPVKAPERRGFGSRFLERGFAREFDGDVSLEFATEGVICIMLLPLSAKLRLAS